MENSIHQKKEKKVEDSVLWLIKPNDCTKNNIFSELNNHGIDKERIIFAERMKFDDHLSIYSLGDLFLDTLNFIAATTTSFVLSSGLHLIKLLGKSYSAIIAASYLSACNLDELITCNYSENETLAYELATNKEKLGYIHDKLNNKKYCSIFDSYKFTNELENIYTNIIKCE